MLVNRRIPRFIVADHPVATYNQYAEHHPDLSRFAATRAWAHRGLQLFLPISPEMSIALYDPQTYQYQSNSRVCGVGPDDVRMLNKLQAAHARSCFYFSSATDVPQDSLDELIECQRKSPARDEPAFEEVYLADRPEHPAIRFRERELRLGTKLSVARPADYNRYPGSAMPVRSVRRLREVREYAELVESRATLTPATEDEQDE